MRNGQLRLTKRLQKAIVTFLETGSDARLKIVVPKEKKRKIYWLNGWVVVRSKQKRRTITKSQDITIWTKRKPERKGAK